MRVCTRRVVGSTCKMFVKIRNVLWRLTCSPGRGDGENIEQRAHAVRVYRTRKYTSACTFRRKPLVLTKYGTFRIVPRTRVRVRARGVPEAQRLPVAVWSGGSVERHRTIYTRSIRLYLSGNINEKHNLSVSIARPITSVLVKTPFNAQSRFGT